MFLLGISESATNVIYKNVNLLLRDFDCPFLYNVMNCNSEEWDIKTLLKFEIFSRIIFFPPPEFPVLFRSISSDRHYKAVFFPGLYSCNRHTFWHHLTLQWWCFHTHLENRPSCHLLPSKSVLMFLSGFSYSFITCQSCIMDSLTIYEITCVLSNWEYRCFFSIFLQFSLE